MAQYYGEAVGWYRLAAEQGDARAQYGLGSAYYEGRGVAQDYGEAVRWFRAAAEQGDAGARYGLGSAYYEGRGVGQDYIFAHMWLNLAAAGGFEPAREFRDEVAARMTRGQIAEAPARARERQERN